MPSSDPFETMSMVSPMTAVLSGPARAGRSVVRSDAAAWLRDAGDPGRELGGPLREERVQLLDRDARALAQRAHGRTGALVEVLLAHEADDLPVLLRQRVDPRVARDRGGHVLGPLIGLLEEALVVHGDVDTGDGRVRHGRSS